MAGKIFIQGISRVCGGTANAKILVDSINVGTVGINEVIEFPVHQDCVFTAKIGLTSMKMEDAYHAKDNTLAVLQLVLDGITGKLTFTVLKEEPYLVVEEEKTPIDVFTEAKMFAQSVELRLLKSPASAIFCSHEEMAVSEQNGIYTVSGYVDSQNSYGALIRTPFTIHVTKHPAVGWVCTDTFVSHEEKASSYLALWIILGIIGTIVSGIITYIQFADLL